MTIETTDGRGSKFISFADVRSDVLTGSSSIKLAAVLCSDAKMTRPNWFFEYHDSLNNVFVLGSRSNTRRPFVASKPSGVYGVAAELGVLRVDLEIPAVDDHCQPQKSCDVPQARRVS
jgi:hypothetical protein